MALALVIGTSGAVVGELAVSSSAPSTFQGELERTAPASHAPVAQSRAPVLTGRELASAQHGASCRDARKGYRWYSRWFRTWHTRMGQAAGFVHRSLGPVPGACPKYLAKLYRSKARAARLRYLRFVEAHTLTEHRWWRKDVREAQRVYPGTEAWLMSCSASEGGWGRWVPNSQGAPPGGWLQMYESTFWRMWRASYAELRARGFRVPASAHSWYSTLGQALAGAWGLKHGRRHEWAGSGC